jgi:hypothetical protein
LYDLETDPTETGGGGEGLGLGTRKRLLLAAREHVEKTVSGRDGEVRLRARLRDVRDEMR